MEIELTRLILQFFIVIVCAGIANLLIPHRIPGRWVGLILVGLLGILIADLSLKYLSKTYNLNYPFLHWQIQQVKIIPSIIGCTVVMYLTKYLMRWGRYER